MSDTTDDGKKEKPAGDSKFFDWTIRLILGLGLVAYFQGWIDPFGSSEASKLEAKETLQAARWEVQSANPQMIADIDVRRDADKLAGLTDIQRDNFNKQYSGKIVEFEHSVWDVERDHKDVVDGYPTYTVTFNKIDFRDVRFPVKCETPAFSTDEKLSIESLNYEQIVVMRGTVSELRSYELHLENCILVSI